MYGMSRGRSYRLLMKPVSELGRHVHIYTTGKLEWIISEPAGLLTAVRNRQEEHANTEQKGPAHHKAKGLSTVPPSNLIKLGSN